jgi:hypothetical protein
MCNEEQVAVPLHDVRFECARARARVCMCVCARARACVVRNVMLVSITSATNFNTVVFLLYYVSFSVGKWAGGNEK